ncbi:MAG: hypothetical protein ACYTFT_07450, partial [Planctomycetota bacterium]
LDLGEAGGIDLEHDDKVSIPYARYATVTSRLFLRADRERIAAHLTTISNQFYGGRLSGYFEEFDREADAIQAYRSFMMAVLPHEIAHALAYRRKVEDRFDGWTEETRAIAFEVAMLRQAVRDEVLGQPWLDAYERFNEILLAAAPEGVVDTLPTEVSARQKVFNQGYKMLHRRLAGEDGPEVIAGADRCLALYTKVRLEALAAPERSWHELFLSMRAGPDRYGMKKNIEAGLEAWGLSPITWTDGVATVPMTGDDGDWLLRIVPAPDTRGIAVTAELERPIVIVGAPRVGVVMHRANRTFLRGGHFELVGQRVHHRQWVGIPHGSEHKGQVVADGIRETKNALAAWHRALRDVAEKGADPRTAGPKTGGK